MKKLIDWYRIKFLSHKYTKCRWCDKVMLKDKSIWNLKTLCWSCDDLRFL